jgi:S1-C subfamily serine protease
MVVNDGDNNLILWPDRIWAFYDLNNSGTRFVGSDDSLGKVYSDLRQRTKESVSANPTGTGFFITEDGYLISNYHVVKDATMVRLLTSAGLIDPKVLQVDAANDLASLKANGRFTPLPIAASRTVNLGGTAATVGFPDIGLQGFAPTQAKGEIASLFDAADDPRYFQISVPVQRGNSGGALVDEQGNVIGIVSAKLKAPVTVDRKFEDAVKSAQDAAVLVLVY